MISSKVKLPLLSGREKVQLKYVENRKDFSHRVNWHRHQQDLNSPNPVVVYPCTYSAQH